MTTSTTTFGRALRAEWPLDPALTYLNHGTVGVTPNRVLQAQRAIQDTIEREPSRFMLRELADVQQWPMRNRPHMRVAADGVAAFLGCRSDDLVFVDNATAGINAVLQSFPFAAGDEILLTDHGYGSVNRIAAHVASRTGAVVRVVALPAPPWSAAAIADAIVAALTPRTRVLVVDHITSGSALVFPVHDIVARAHAAGVAVLVDGAHTPGHLDLDIAGIGADWYTGNLHKWMMTPRSSGILWVAPERQAGLHPPVISWGHGLGLAAEFDLLGTRDPSPWLAAPAGIEFLRSLGLDAVRAWNHGIAWGAAESLCARWGVERPAPESMVAGMVTLPLPPRVKPTREAVQSLRDTLLFEDRIEVQMHPAGDRAWVRICGQAYVEAADIERLAGAIEKRI